MDNENNRRRHSRHDIPLEGKLTWRGQSMPCQVRNLSAGGALVEVESTLRPGHLITIEVPELGKMTGRVVRMIWKLAGISLEEGEAEVDAFIVEWLERESKDTESP